MIWGRVKQGLGLPRREDNFMIEFLNKSMEKREDQKEDKAVVDKEAAVPWSSQDVDCLVFRRFVQCSRVGLC